MADLVQIKVNPAELEKSEKKLAVLLQDTVNRHVKVQFTSAKGGVEDNLITAAEQLNSVGEALARLISKTQSAVTNTRTSFSETDNISAQWFGIMRD